MTERNTPRLQQVLHHLDRSYNLILQGPPASGKTHTALAVVRALYQRDQTERLTDPGWKTCRWSHLARFMDSDWLAAPLVWEVIQLHSGWHYEHLVRSSPAATSPSEPPANARQSFRSGMRPDEAPSGAWPQDRLLLELIRVAQRREERALKRDTDCGPTLLIIEDIHRADLSAILGDLLQALDPAQRTTPTSTQDHGLSARLRDTPPLAGTEPLTVSVPASLRILCTHTPDPQHPAKGLDAQLLRRFRVLDCPADDRLLAVHFKDYPDARRAARASFRAVAQAIGDQVALMPGHGYWMVDDCEDWPQLLSEALVYDVMALLRHYRSLGLLRADTVRFENGPDSLSITLDAHHDQWLQADHLRAWLLRLG